MPVHGKATSIILGAYPVSSWFNSISTSESQDTSETTAFQDNDKTYVLGASDATFDASGRYEGDVKQIREIVYTQIQAQVEAVVTVGWGMGGPKAGNDAEFGRTWDTSWQITSPVGDIVSTSLSGAFTDGIGHGKHLIDLAAAKSATATGPSVQLATAYTTGLALPAGTRWAVALHRLIATGTAVSAIKVQTSADGSTGWTDLAGATATFNAAETGSKLVAGTATIVGPYVRAVETITGTGTSQALAAFGLY